MTLTEFSQAVLIYYAANMLLALMFFRPGSKNFEQLMSHPVAQQRPALILMILMHVLIPAMLASNLHPKRLAFYLRRLFLPLRIWLARRRIAAQIATHPAAMQSALKAQIAKIPPQKLPDIWIMTPREAARAQRDADRNAKDAEDDQ